MLETDFDEIISTKIVTVSRINNMEDKRQNMTRSTTTQKLLRGSSEDSQTDQCDKETSEGFKDLVVNDICRQVDTPPTAKFKRWLLPSMCADYVLAQLVIGPLITSCWRSAWLSFNLLIGGPSFITASICVISGLALANLLCQTGHLWTSISGQSSRSLKFFLTSRSYTVFSFGSSMVLWKGAWDLCKLLKFGKNFEVALVVLALGTLSSAVLRHSRAGVGFPLVFSASDEPSSYYKVGCGEGGVTSYNNTLTFMLTTLLYAS